MYSPLVPFFYDEAHNFQITGDQRTVSAFEVAQAVLDDSLDLLIQEPSMPRRLGMHIKRVNYLHGYRVDSIEEAEEILFSRIHLETFTFSDEYHGATYHHNDLTRANLVNKLISTCSRIAHITRRGAGNVVFMGSTVLDEIRRLSVAFVEGEHKADGRWTDVGIFCNTIRVYTGPIPHDEVYAAYVGQRGLIDGPAGLVESNGDLFLIENQCALNPAENFLNGFRAVLA
jgi:hypothetical protein